MQRNTGTEKSVVVVTSKKGLRCLITLKQLHTVEKATAIDKDDG